MCVALLEVVTRKSPRDQAGVSVVELVIVAAIAGIMALAVAPVIGAALSDSKTRGAAEQVAGALRLARERAISTATTYSVSFTSDAISIACVDNCPSPRPPDTTEPAVTGASLSSNVSRILFTERGAASPAGTVTVTYQGATSWIVTVTPIGRVRMCKGSCQ